MPTYNSSEYVCEALESLRNQNGKQFELIVVDGASEDDTVSLVKQYGKYFPLTVISEPDTGVPEALNKGFNLANGNVFCWLNADDVFVSENATLLAERSLRDRAGFAYGHSLVIDVDGFVQNVLRAWEMGFIDFKKGSNIFTGSLFFARQEWINFGAFDLKYTVAFEYELLTYLFRSSKPILIDKTIAAFRQNPKGLSKTHGQLMLDQRKEIVGCFPAPDWGLLFQRFGSEVKSRTIISTILGKMSRRYIGRHYSSIARLSG